MIEQYWPFEFQPRKSQVIAFEWAAEQIDKGIKYLLCEIPVGGGKSPLGISIANYIDNTNQPTSLIFTPQIILQKQYEESFSDLVKKQQLHLLYGKQNHICLPDSDPEITCDIGSLLSHPPCGGAECCSYKQSVNKCFTTKHVVINYSIGLIYMTCLRKQMKKLINRKILIFDEGHNLEDNLIKFSTITITNRKLEKLNLEKPTITSTHEFTNWLANEYLLALEDYMTKKYQELNYLIDQNNGKVTSKGIKIAKEIEKLDKELLKIKQFINDKTTNENDFIVANEKDKIYAKELYAKRLFEKIDNQQAVKLFMSSTILDKNVFCQSLGIDPSQTEFLSLPSEFDKENRKVYYIPTIKMNRKWKEDSNEKDRKNLIETLHQILQNFHKNDSGIIHTGNYEIASWLVNELRGKIKHTIYTHSESGRERNKVIKEFLLSEQPSVLISPSITEGLDLIDDLGRFAIFVKVPFGNLGDPWINKRFQLSPKWYEQQALINIIQGSGRVVRTHDDWGVVYILDSSWSYLFHKTKNKIPQWWKDSYQEI